MQTRKPVIQEWKETGRTTYNILKEAVPDYPSGKIAVKAVDTHQNAELSINFV